MEIEERLKKLESRLTHIEKLLADNILPKKRDAVTPAAPAPMAPSTSTPAAPASAASPTPASPLVATQAKNNYSSVQVPNFPPVDPNVKASLHFVDTHAFNKARSQNSNYLLMPVAVLGFLLVSFFILRFGLDTGWLSPTKQLMLTVFASVILIAAGFFYKELNNEYIQYLPGLGILLLFLAAFGSTNFYHFFPKNAAFLFIGTVGVCSMLMYQEFRHAIYMIVAAAGAYIIPLYVANPDNITLTNSYFLMISLIFSGLACWINLRPVYLLCAYLALPISAISEYHDNDMLHKTMFIMAHFLIFTGGMLIHIHRSKQPITKAELIAFAPIVLLFVVIEYYNINQFNTTAAPVAVVLACLYVGALFVRARKPVESKPAETEEIQIVQN